MTLKALDRALALLGPLEARIMREAWSGAVPRQFVVQDMRDHMPELAYTTVMTTLSRLASKGLLQAHRVAGQRAFTYAPAESPTEYLARAGSREAEELLARFGEAALVAFARQLDQLTPAQSQRLRRLTGR